MASLLNLGSPSSQPPSQEDRQGTALVSNLDSASSKLPTQEGSQSTYSLSYFEAFPPGYRFKPSDEELIQYYLKNRVDGRPLPPNKIIEDDIYFASPDYLLEKNKKFWPERDCYFFTPRNRKYKNGRRPNRQTLDGDGYWKATGSDKRIICRNTVGYKRSLVYYKGNFTSGNKTDWIMHEYTMDSKTTKIGTSDMRLDDVVLCKIFKRETKAEKGKKAEGGAGPGGAPSTWDASSNGRNEEMYHPINYNNTVTNFPNSNVEHNDNYQHFQNYSSPQPEPNIVSPMNCYPPQQDPNMASQMNYYPPHLESNMASQLNYYLPQPEPNITSQLNYYPLQPERNDNYQHFQNYYSPQPEPNIVSPMNYNPPQPEPKIDPQMEYYPPHLEPNMASQLNYYPPQPEPIIAFQPNYYPLQPESNIASQLGNGLPGLPGLLPPPIQVQALQGEFYDEQIIDEALNGFLLYGRPTSQFEVPSENDFNYLSECLDPSFGFGSTGFSED